MQKKIENIVIIGAGNVAVHLATFLSKHVSIEGIISRNGVSAKLLASNIGSKWIETIEQIPACDLILICTNDSVISEIVSQIPDHFNIAYTSGSIELDTNTKRENFGVFYPLQTFSKDREINLSNVPFFIEATNPFFAEQLLTLAKSISSNVSFSTSLDRKKLHLSAVIVNNFINHLAYIAKDFADHQNINWEHLKPLIQETTNKIITSSPKESQTGPARRNDLQIIEEHLNMLNGYPKEIYKLLSNSIIDTYSKNNKE